MILLKYPQFPTFCKFYARPFFTSLLVFLILYSHDGLNKDVYRHKKSLISIPQFPIFRPVCLLPTYNLIEPSQLRMGDETWLQSFKRLGPEGYIVISLGSIESKPAALRGEDWYPSRFFSDRTIFHFFLRHIFRQRAMQISESSNRL